MAEASSKRCVVAYATREHQYLWTVDLPHAATIDDALKVARGLAAETLTTRSTRDELQKLPWDTAPVGIFGEPHRRGFGVGLPRFIGGDFNDLDSCIAKGVEPRIVIASERHEPRRMLLRRCDQLRRQR